MSNDPFKVQRIGKKAVVVDHPIGGPQLYGVEDDSFWERGVEEQRQKAIDSYVDSINLKKSDPTVSHQIMADAGWFDNMALEGNESNTPE